MGARQDTTQHDELCLPRTCGSHWLFCKMSVVQHGLLKVGNIDLHGASQLRYPQGSSQPYLYFPSVTCSHGWVCVVSSEQSYHVH